MVPAVVETVNLYPDQLGARNWILIKNVILGIVAVIALVTGSFTCILEIIHFYTAEQQA